MQCQHSQHCSLYCQMIMKGGWFSLVCQCYEFPSVLLTVSVWVGNRKDTQPVSNLLQLSLVFLFGGPSPAWHNSTKEETKAEHVFSWRLKVVSDVIIWRDVQIVREINRVGDGLGLRVHFIRKASDDVKKRGSELLRKFGKHGTLCVVCYTLV